MDLSHPAYDLFGRSTARILQRLAAVNDGLTGRRLSQLAEVSLSSTQRILARLENVGLIETQPVGRAVIYSVNRNHLLWTVIDSAFDVTRKVEELVTEIVQNYSDVEMTVALYGSFARGEAGPDSDLDIVVIWLSGMDENTQSAVLGELSEQLFRATGNSVEIIDLPLPDLQRMATENDPLVASWKREAKTLTQGPDLRELLKLVAA
ncbi:nucleotidyltransferase domain-containing protein [Arthrobacter glacialis]|uniref:nucleotidyltransferase domain-containing protein n=1 Tax=Arthrobacter glacialis TaxID=1664 RepID=UPI000CD3CE29|nr:nucleotidyltransferase domain-containing protein [Arthrobacter glacialis]POH60167.1 hypothetical protein CVS28_04270 [Arthrobacter glacialis]